MGVRAISMSGMMDKTWCVVIRCLGGKKLMEIVMVKNKVGLERRTAGGSLMQGEFDIASCGTT
ncbi:hypothetical protein L195_g058759 [Trifolium pratense]|uniref:Uncharacterized protein n=1 Tax=Trifolium pratense TaxID=57577 RepID=A0A2K3JU48_TRIPR|nr:hypothetical protein L195_g058759 [Trifolium pratense]